MEPVVSREAIAIEANHAAKRMAKQGVQAVNPYPVGSAAAAAWQASLERWLLWHTAPEAEASA